MTAADIATFASLGVALVGFGITIKQVRTTLSATRATRKAVEDTERRITHNHLLVILPQFRLLEADLDTAVGAENRELAIRTLVTYRHLAGEAASLLQLDEAQRHSEIVAELRVTMEMAGSTKNGLVNSGKVSIKSGTKTFRLRITQTVNDLSAMIGGIRLEAGR